MVIAQSISSDVYVRKVFSQNENFYLHTIPFDNLEPSLRGKTLVYKVGTDEPIYVLDRGFDSNENELILSNNGEIIVAIHGFFAYEDIEGLKSVSVYKNGNLYKGFTKNQLTGCDEEKERCKITYTDYSILDRQKTGWKDGKYKRVFKKIATEQDIFLFEYEVFNHDDKLYITDSNKKTHLFDLKEGIYLGFESFEKIYPRLKEIARHNKVETERYNAPYYFNFPNLQNGKDTKKALAAFLGMKVVDSDDEQYKSYRFKVFGTVFQNGSIEIDKIESDNDSLKTKIKEFFDTNKFDTKAMPKVFEQFYIDGNYYEFRKSDDKIARHEKKEEIIERRKALQKRLVAEMINDIYIPKDLGEAFAKLDEELKEVDKNDIKNLPKKEETLKYHHGLGRWMRNNWGLWGGSRLQTYFLERGISHPDDMSSVVLEFYYDWLNGNKESWQTWDKNALSKTKQK